MEFEDDAVLLEQARLLDQLHQRIDDTLSYVDWLFSITDEDYEPYLLQLIKLLEGTPIEH